MLAPAKVFDNKEMRVIAAKGKLMHGLIRAFTVHGESQHCFSLLHTSRENFSRDGALVTRACFIHKVDAVTIIIVGKRRH